MAPKAYPPGPLDVAERRRPFGERMRELAKGPLVVIRGRFERYGDMFFTTNRGTPMYVTRHPDHIHEVLVTKAASFVKRSRDLEMFLGQGLLTSNGEVWRRQRRLIQPAFQHAKIARYAEVMVEHTERMLDTWSDGQVRSISRDMMELTLSVVCKTLLDHDIHGGPAADEVARAMTILQETAGAFEIFPPWVPTPLHVRKRRAVKALDQIIYPMIDAHSDPEGRDLISDLKLATDEGGAMSKEQLRDELVTLFLAGHETTALAMTWTFFLLSHHPALEARLHEEIDRVLAGRNPSFADLEALSFTKNVLQEAMRLFPPIYILPRVADEDVEIGGWELAKGSEVVLWVYFCHRDARWFPNPDAFEPDRFQPGSKGILHPHAYLPFGAGPRTCIGRHFAIVEAQLLLAAIARRWKLRLEPGQEVKLNARATLGPQQPIMLRIERRS